MELDSLNKNCSLIRILFLGNKFLLVWVFLFVFCLVGFCFQFENEVFSILVLICNFFFLILNVLSTFLVFYDMEKEWE